MLVVDASCMFEVLTEGPLDQQVSRRLATDANHVVPHIVDVEVFGAIRRDHHRGLLDGTQAAQAVARLADWPAKRFGHQLMLGRAWELRDTVRGWDAMYVALAEILDAVLITTDVRLARAVGPICRIELPGSA